MYEQKQVYKMQSRSIEKNNLIATATIGFQQNGTFHWLSTVVLNGRNSNWVVANELFCLFNWDSRQLWQLNYTGSVYWHSNTYSQSAAYLYILLIHFTYIFYLYMNSVFVFFYLFLIYIYMWIYVLEGKEIYLES